MAGATATRQRDAICAEKFSGHFYNLKTAATLASSAFVGAGR